MLHDISDTCKESVTVSIVSLDSTPSMGHETVKDFRIRMKCECDIHSCNDFKPILEKHNLVMNEEKGFIILYSKT